MIVDLDVGGVLMPGLVALAFVALIATMAVLRLLAASGLNRLFAYRPLVELATFVIIYGLLVLYLPLIGLLP
ncbi:DUF1656 domain-containing protein [Ochrobactrum sp. Marseille-Q0166]|uniref:DUF1656 domain-containing protein n=1 Tax=Ochrobactrum sp. Marseille-Q0166 TaxID=2761105 RepID=UPI001655BD5D|nr:DUF1656 domain-containing protein [Ochrobactrum sp. Marseille-Q0166]MBC8716761.1 DUF1656 domain-containing protein [Ochrobactrum sp. Marseille-Q0166]